MFPEIPTPLIPELNPTEFDEKAYALVSAINSMADTPYDIVLSVNMMDVVPRELSFTPITDDERIVLGSKHRLTVVVSDLLGTVPVHTVTVELHPLVDSPTWVDDDVREVLFDMIVAAHSAACADVIGTMADLIGWDIESFVSEATAIAVPPGDISLIMLARAAQFEMWKLLNVDEIPDELRIVMAVEYASVVARNDANCKRVLDKHRGIPVAQPADTAVVNDGRWN